MSHHEHGGHHDPHAHEHAQCCCQRHDSHSHAPRPPSPRSSPSHHHAQCETAEMAHHDRYAHESREASHNHEGSSSSSSSTPHHHHRNEHPPVDHHGPPSHNPHGRGEHEYEHEHHHHGEHDGHHDQDYGRPRHMARYDDDRGRDPRNHNHEHEHDVSPHHSGGGESSRDHRHSGDYGTQPQPSGRTSPHTSPHNSRHPSGSSEVVHGHSHESSDGGHVSEGISLKLSGSRDDEAHGHYGDHHSSHSSGSAAHSPSRGHTDSHASSSSHHSSSRTSEKYARVKKENKALGLICRFTPEQMTDFNNAFRKTGKRYDGELNLAEFRSILHLVLPVEEITDQDTKTLFELMDVDYSGGVSFKEFCLWSSIFTGASTSQDKSAWLDVMFTMLDTDDSGTLDADEIAIGYMRVVKGTTMLAGGSADSEELQATSAHITDAVNNHFKGRKKISKPEFMKFWEALTGE